jgi:V8-like Glu-specific endopeptidase
MSTINSSDYIRSAAEAEYFVPESVCGVDERVVVNPLDPYFEAICFLCIDAADGTKWRGTAFYINFGGQAALLTAGHCVYMRDHGGFPSNVHIIRGRNGDKEPFGITTIASSGLRVNDQWKSSPDQNYDWGLILVGGQRWGLGVQIMTDDILVATQVKTAGYPGDKPGYQMWAADGPVKSVSPQKVYYMQDTYGGQSGCPLWAPVPGQSYSNVVGVHAYGGCPNSATRLTNDILSQINAWTSSTANSM